MFTGEWNLARKFQMDNILKSQLTHVLSSFMGPVKIEVALGIARTLALGIYILKAGDILVASGS